MGAEFDSAFIKDTDLKLTDTELRKQAEGVFEHSAYMNGHGGYSGSLAEKSGRGITIHRSRVCETMDEAWEVMDELDNDKWGPAECVPVTGKGWAIGGYCSS